MLALIGALKEEIADLRRQMVIDESSAGQGYRIYRGKYHGKDVLLAQTGMGKENAERATEFILKQYQVTILICLGYSGALVKELEAGDIALCAILHSDDEWSPESSGIQNPVYSDDDLVSMAVETQKVDGLAGFHKVSSVTTANLITEPKDKLALGRAFHAEVVDMESYWIAAMASVRRIPFLSVRAISDTVEDRLPPFDLFMDSGSLQWRRAAVYFFVRPLQLLGLFWLYRNTRLARKNLTAFIDSFTVRI